MKGIDPIKKLKVKQARLQGKSMKRSCLDAGYTEATAINACQLSVVKHCDEEIKQSILKAGVTEEEVITGLRKESQTAPKPSDRIAALSWLGKVIAMFTDKQQVDAKIITEEDKAIIEEYMPKNRLNNILKE
jgi:hypothetical protein